jgi:CRISPR-associated protein Cas5t
MLQLRIKAPFGAFRIFNAGAYRATAPTLTPSAGYGLLLHLAGVESRFDDGKSAMTLMRNDLPPLEVAVGVIRMAEVQTVYQQLHNYPVGSQGKERAESCKGNKYNIQPVRREYLTGLDVYLCCRDNPEIEDRIRRALRGERTAGEPARYGIPFLGDNNFLIDRIEEGAAAAARWLAPLSGKEAQAGSGRMRLSVWIDRADMRHTRERLYVWSDALSNTPPHHCWTQVAKNDV